MIKLPLLLLAEAYIGGSGDKGNSEEKGGDHSYDNSGPLDPSSKLQG